MTPIDMMLYGAIGYILFVFVGSIAVLSVQNFGWLSKAMAALCLPMSYLSGVSAIGGFVWFLLEKFN